MSEQEKVGGITSYEWFSVVLDPLALLLSVPSCIFPGLAFPLPPSPFPFAGLAFPLPPSPLPPDPSPELSVELLAEYNGQKFNYNDLVDVIMGTGPGVVGKKSEPIKARFKGVVEVLRRMCTRSWR